MTEPRNWTLGTISGSTPIIADVSVIGNTATTVVLLVDYAVGPRPVGYPSRPSMTGTDAAGLDYSRIILAGNSITVANCEARALVDAGAATLA